MENLNLKRVFNIMNKLSYEEAKLSEEQDKWVSLLGNSSSYCPDGNFDSFLNYYSFKIDGGYIVVFNTDPIPYEQYDNDDVSYFPLFLLSLGEKDLDEWIDNEIKTQLEQQEKDKIAEKENLKEHIEKLQKRYESI